MFNPSEIVENKTAILRKIEPVQELYNRQKQIQKLVIHASGSVYLITPNSIRYCTADGSYTRFFLDNGDRLIASQPIKSFEKKLKAFGFQRTHQSILVSFERIYKINKESIELTDGTKLALSRRKRKDLLSLINQQPLSCQTKA